MRAFTHSGLFHGDDLIAYSILARLNPGMEPIRTREASVLKTFSPGDIMFDVGLVYDPEQGKFDHHQKQGAGERENGVPYASCGLIWKHYGKDYLRTFGVAEEHLDKIHQQVDRGFIQGIDADDCGVSYALNHLQSDPSTHLPDLSLNNLLYQYNPVPLLEKETPALIDERFHEASRLAIRQLEFCVLRRISRQMGLSKLEAADTGGPVLVMDEFVPWQEFASTRPNLLFVVFPSQDTWRCQVIPAKQGSFDARKSLPAGWAGLNETELAAATGVADSTFCHNGRFICGASTKEGALALAKKAVDHNPELSEPELA